MKGSVAVAVAAVTVAVAMGAVAMGAVAMGVAVMEAAAMAAVLDLAEAMVLLVVQRAVAGVIGLIGGGLIITKPQLLL